MTPVDATSTCSTGQPTSARGLRRHVARDLAGPSSPVQAFAQPLLTTIARAMPPERCEVLARDDDRRRDARGWS